MSLSTIIIKASLDTNPALYIQRTYHNITLQQAELDIRQAWRDHFGVNNPQCLNISGVRLNIVYELHP